MKRKGARDKQSGVGIAHRRLAVARLERATAATAALVRRPRAAAVASGARPELLGARMHARRALPAVVALEYLWASFSTLSLARSLWSRRVQFTCCAARHVALAFQARARSLWSRRRRRRRFGLGLGLNSSFIRAPARRSPDEFWRLRRAARPRPRAQRRLGQRAPSRSAPHALARAFRLRKHPGPCARPAWREGERAAGGVATQAHKTSPAGRTIASGSGRAVALYYTFPPRESG